ncbi:MAG: hypothetical protein Q4C73_03030 [Eubacteriales bacterium]|nr:hypothetical protein [Eubacteriales bacterium]
MRSEELLAETDALGIPVTEKPFRTYDGRIKNNKIYLRTGLSDAQKACVLAEELGHYHTTVGDIIDQQSVSDVKQELRARSWAYDKMIGLFGLVEAYRHGCTSLYEVANYLDVTEVFLRDALEAYRRKYGTGVRCRDYYISFEPNLRFYCFSSMEFGL